MYRNILGARERTLGQSTKALRPLAAWRDLPIRKCAEAEAMYLRVLSTRERTLGAGHLPTCCLATTWILLLKLNRPAEALDHLQQTLAAELSLYGGDNPELAMTHWNLARCLRKQNDQWRPPRSSSRWG